MPRTVPVSDNRDWWETPVLNSLQRLTREKAAYIVIAVVALTLRLWALGARAVSFDECQHLYFSWQPYSVGSIFKFDPVTGPITHGPFLFLANTLMYTLFGVSDFTSRLASAFFGTALALLPYLLRKYLGRGGALAAAVMLTVSPFLLFYSRDNLHEIYGAVWTMLMAIAFLHYVDERKPKYLYLFGAAVGFYLCTKAVAYIMGFIVVTFVVVVLVWERLSESVARQVRRVGLGASAVALALLVWLTNRPQPAGTVRSALLPVLVVITCLFAAAVLAGWAHRGAGKERPVGRALASIRWPQFWAMVGIGLGVVVLLYTTFFTNPRGLTGPISQLSYWFGQHGEARGGQPWYYFLLVLMPMYEFLPLVGGVAAIVYYVAFQRRPHPERDAVPFVPFVVFWAVSAVAIHSWTGEKMPQHTVYLVLPFILLTGRLLQDWLGDVNWAGRRKGDAVAFFLLVPAAGYSLTRLVSIRPFGGFTQAQLNATMLWLVTLGVAVGLAWALARLGERLGTAMAWRVCAASLFAVLLVLTVRYSWMASFMNYDNAKELIVYAHGTQDAKVTLNEILDISRRTVGDNRIKVAFDSRTGFPFGNWYLRDFPNAISFSGENPSREALDSPIVIVHGWNDGKVRPLLANYDRFPRLVMWWPVEDYKGLTPARLWAMLKGPAKRAEIWNILWARDYPYALNEWPYREEMILYIRKDVTAQLWKYGTLTAGVAPQPTAVAEDPYAAKKVLVPAVLTFGRQGQGPGEFQDPRGVAVDAAGNIYVVDTGNHRVQVFDANGRYLRGWGQYGSGPGEFNEPWGIAVDKEGNVYVADTWNYRVQKFDQDGKFVTMWGESGDSAGDALALPGAFYGPRAVALAGDGTVLVMDTGNERIQRFTAEGQYVAGYGGFGAGAGQFWEPVGLAVDGGGNVYVADTWNRRVQVFDSRMRYVREWGVKAWAGESVLNKPYLAVDGRGHVYASDPEGHRVLEWTVEGEFVASYGEYGMDESRFSLPVGLAVDGSGRLIVADSGNHRIMVFAPFGP
ncbi:MAG: TIGR03663 family protein [Anaerolineae bacterium]|nr:TIGR03663 family protein [Anaerolineae bacterium]